MTRPISCLLILGALGAFAATPTVAAPVERTTTWAHDPTGDDAYAVSGDCEIAPLLHRVDGVTGARSVVGALLDARCVTHVGFDRRGRLYGYDRALDVVLEIDPRTAEARTATRIGAGVFWHGHEVTAPPAEQAGVLTLTVTGPCPGIITIEIAGASPGDRVALFDSAITGQAFLPDGTVCPGTEIGLLPPLELLSLFTIPSSGVLTVDHEAPPMSCQFIMQSLNGNTCEVSNLEPVAEP